MHNIDALGLNGDKFPAGSEKRMGLPEAKTELWEREGSVISEGIRARREKKKNA